MSSYFKDELSKYGDDVTVQNASQIYKRTEAANGFVYFGQNDSTNVVPNYFLCTLCNEMVESKHENGSNPLYRHQKTCCKTFVHLSTLDFCILMAKVLERFGMEISMQLIQRKVMDLARLYHQR